MIIGSRDGAFDKNRAAALDLLNRIFEQDMLNRIVGI
jgi:hypothetical protein